MATQAIMMTAKVMITVTVTATATVPMAVIRVTVQMPTATQTVHTQANDYPKEKIQIILQKNG